MKCDPIFCSGNELKSVLDGIEARKGVVTDLHTSVGGHNASYKVNYFERVEELAPPVAVRKDAAGTYCQQVNNPAALNPFTQHGETPEVSIETRLARLQEKLSAAGKIKRSKTREARLPHPND